jgi:ferredoxin-NADP reductase
VVVADLKQGAVTSFHRLSDELAILRLLPEDGSRFPTYKPGQYIALRRDDCRLTRRVVDASGRARYVHDVDESGKPRRGPVTHSYSIASAPFETEGGGYLEFYVVLERGDVPGRLTESLFGIDGGEGDHVKYHDRITGDFTLDKRAASRRDVLMVGTGTGVAPFVSMVKQLHHEAARGGGDGKRYTLIHANRTREELAYHEELSAAAASERLDLVYVGSVSRPATSGADPDIGAGRATNLLRHVFDMPLKEEEDLAAARARGGDVGSAEKALARTVRPRLPDHVNHQRLRDRLDPAQTVVLTCGNPAGMADVAMIAGRLAMRYEKEDWKPGSGAHS